jgi:ribosomal protein S27AE
MDKPAGEKVEVAECANCHGSIPRGQGVEVGDRRLCAGCSAGFTVAEIMSASECQKCGRLIKAAEWKTSAMGDLMCPHCHGLPGQTVNATSGAPELRHPGAEVLVVILSIVGAICGIGGLVKAMEVQQDDLVIAAMFLAALFWVVLAVFLSIGRRILMSLEDLVKAQKPPKT